MTKREGFTLIELMIVVAIIAIIAAIAIPSLIRSRLAANEAAAVAACKAYSEAQEVYHRTDYDRDGVLEYSQKMAGNNSLLETQAGLGDLALVDKALASAEGAPGSAPLRAGYVFTVLTSQGASASGGARTYMVGTNMLMGYGLCAVPGAYDGTGRNTFVVNQDGVVFQADRGSATTTHEDTFNPAEPLFTPTQ
ncbi:MAG TPA: DUF2950 family protein [Planctomycetota bacterium]|nr:DUF2950 family protein [Planctomycetota bacterium]